MHSKLGLARVLAAMVVLALAVGVPTAAAGPKLDKKQNKAIKKQNRTNKKQGKAIKRGNKAVSNIRKAAKATDEAIAALKIVAERGDKNATGILALAPSIVKGLTDLQTGLVAAGAGLNSLKTLAGSTEYGFGQVIVVQAGPTFVPQVGAFVVTPNIPDDAQQAQTEQTFEADDTGTLLVQYGVRSNETDGDGTVPAALCKVTVINQSNAHQSTADNAAIGNLPFQPVLTKSTVTSTVVGNEGFPFGLKTVAPDADVTQNLATAIPVTAGEVYTVDMSCVDTSPSATDPSA